MFRKSSQKIKFTIEEDALILKFYEETTRTTSGRVSWMKIADNIPNRSNKQVRERYINFLKKDISQEPFTEEEFELLEKKVGEFRSGNVIPWKKITQFFPGRTDIFLKNKFDRSKRKALKKQLKKDLEMNEASLNQLLWGDEPISIEELD